MNTTVPALEITEGTASVRQWLAAIHARGLLFHFDDDAHDVAFPDGVTDTMRNDLNRYATEAREFCDSVNVDIFDLCMELNT